MNTQKGIALVLASLISFSSFTFANQKKEEIKKEIVKKVKPENINKNNVSDTSKEKPDQVDTTLIEGNLENNDFKN